MVSSSGLIVGTAGLCGGRAEPEGQTTLEPCPGVADGVVWLGPHALPAVLCVVEADGAVGHGVLLGQGREFSGTER